MSDLPDKKTMAKALERIAADVLLQAGREAEKAVGSEHAPPVAVGALSMALATLLGRGLRDDDDFEEALATTVHRIRDYARIVRTGVRPS